MPKNVNGKRADTRNIYHIFDMQAVVGAVHEFWL